MAYPILDRPRSGLALFERPYERFAEIDERWQPDVCPPRGQALVWWLWNGASQQRQFEWLHDRSPALPLFIVLPPAQHLGLTMPLLRYIGALSPRAVLPAGRIVIAETLRTMLAAPPANMAQALIDHLSRRGLLRAEGVRREVKRIFELAPETSSISQLARRLYTSRRTLGRHFLCAGLPVPCHWLQFARLMHIVGRLQNDPSAVFRVVLNAGYADAFTMSNQMKRLVGSRPSEVRQLLGWEWVVESWLAIETRIGAIDASRYQDVVGAYVAYERPSFEVTTVDATVYDPAVGLARGWRVGAVAEPV